MKTQARLKHLHIAPRKARLLADCIRGLDVVEALEKIQYTNKKSAPYFEKLLNSAIANGENNLGLIKENLYIYEIRVDGSSPYKRWQPRAFGRAYPILKRTSHVTIVLDEKEKGKRRKDFKKQRGVIESEPEEKKKGEAKDSKAKKPGFLKKGMGRDKKAAGEARVKGRFFRRKSG